VGRKLVWNFQKIAQDWNKGLCTDLELVNNLLDLCEKEPLATLESDVGPGVFEKLSKRVQQYPWDDDGWEKLKLYFIGGFTPGPGFREAKQREAERRDRLENRFGKKRMAHARAVRDERPKKRLRASVERFRAHFGIGRSGP
jgi:hypothetical protein